MGRRTLRGAILGAVVAGAIVVAVFLVFRPEEADDQTIALAKRAYARAVEQGVDLERGPCLGVLKPDWVADVAHDPREPVDDEPANQCEAYRSGAADHYVELDPQGNYIGSGGRFGL